MCPNRLAHGPGVQTLELLLSSVVAQEVAASACLSGPADAVAEVTSTPSVTIAQLARPPGCSERVGQRWRERRECAARREREWPPMSSDGT